MQPTRFLFSEHLLKWADLRLHHAIVDEKIPFRQILTPRIQCEYFSIETRGVPLFSTLELVASKNRHFLGLFQKIFLELLQTEEC
jgi:hypothetical protein